jgi:integrase
MARRSPRTGSITWFKPPTKVLLRIVDDHGKHRSKTVKVSHKERGGRGEANDALEVFKGEVAAERERDDTRTLRTLLAAYTESRQRIRRRQGTVEQYENCAKRLDDKVGNKPLDEVTAKDLDDFYDRLSKRGLADSTIATTHASIAAALEQARKWGWVTATISKDATPPRAKPRRNGKLNPADVWDMVDAADGAGNRVLSMTLFMAAYTGARRGELCGLRWADLDVNASTIHIARQWVPGKGGQYIEELKSETGTDDEGRRTVTLAPEVVDLIERYRDWQHGHLGYEPDGWMLSEDGGTTPLRAKTVTENTTALARKLGLNISLHNFRKFHQTQIVSAGVDVDTAGRRAGQSPEILLRHYAQGDDAAALAAALALSDRFNDQGMPIGELFSAD